jgi:hypothetical protein
MTKIGKTLIAAVLLAELGFAGYVMFSKDDRSPVETGARTNSSATTSGVDSLSAGARVVAGTVNGAATPASSAHGIAAAPQPSSAGNVAPESAPATRRIVQAPRPEAQSHQQPSPTLKSADASNVSGSKASPVTGSERGRDDLHRPGSNDGSTAATDQLVRESAKLDPALPPPDPSYHDGLPRRGSSDVAAAMTDQLVRESAKLDPALPPPKPQSSSRPGTQ